MDRENEQAASSRHPIPLLVQLAALLFGPALIGGREIWTWLGQSVEQRAADLPHLLVSLGPWLIWLLVLPVVLAQRRAPALTRRRRPASPLPCFLFAFVLAFGVAAGLGWRLRDLPPLYHDEHSYQFQAWTFLSGRLSNPTPPFASHFQQMHVLDDPVFAGRYFPGTGLWLAPFLWLGFPALGGWALAGLVSGFTSLAAFRVHPRAGYVAGALLATAPALVALANLTLSPTPTMLGLAVFLWSYPRIFPERGPGPSQVWPIIAGLAIGYAFLCRPLTAAGLGLPFALYSLWRLAFPRSTTASLERAQLLRLTASFGLCLPLLAAYNWAITKRPWVTPYGLYLERHTPSHVYGLHNRMRGETARGPRTLVAYDDWAEDLDLRRAARLAGQRWERLIPWSFGAISLAALGLVVLYLAPRDPLRLGLPILGVVGLSAAYFPYAFPGILGFGYLVEAVPWLGYLVAVAAGSLHEDWRHRGRPNIGCWWLALPLVAAGTNLFADLSLFEPDTELVYPRRQAARRAQWEQKASLAGPILVLVDAEPRDSLHTSYVFNQPDLAGPVLRAWYRPIDGSPSQLDGLLAHYPERAAYVYRPARGAEPESWTLIRPRVDGPGSSSGVEHGK